MSGADLAAIQIDPADARALLDTRGPDGVHLLDVRQPAEYEAFHLPGARLVPLPELEARWRELDPKTPVVAYCHVGSRSLAAAHFLRHRGFVNARSLAGGTDAWRGGTAFGPEDWGFELVSAKASAAEAAATALALETGLRTFYEDLADRSTDEEAGALLTELVGVEAGHERKVRGILETLAPGHGTSDVGGRVEGGFSAGELMQAAARFADDTAGLLGLAMMVECQALDLYLRLSCRGGEGSVRALWWELAADERAHLASLGALVDRRALA